MSHNEVGKTFEIKVKIYSNWMHCQRGSLKLRDEEVFKPLKWVHAPKSCDNHNPKSPSYFSLAGISRADKSP